MTRLIYMNLEVKMVGSPTTRSIECYGWFVRDNLLCLQNREGKVYKCINLNSVVDFTEA